jgi:hypothetical protein
LFLLSGGKHSVVTSRWQTPHIAAVATNWPALISVHWVLPFGVEIVYFLRLVFVYIYSVRTVRNSFTERNCYIIYTLRLYGTWNYTFGFYITENTLHLLDKFRPD